MPAKLLRIEQNKMLNVKSQVHHVMAPLRPVNVTNYNTVEP